MHGIGLFMRLLCENEKMNVVYVFDKNCLPYFELSVQSVLKFNPNAHITVVSPEKLDIEFENIVMDAPRLKHRENDRITDTTYLKLMLPKLPYDKILYIDADVLCLKPLNELWEQPCKFISLTESHIAGERQALEHGHEKYGLSGVMLMNLDILRKFNFTEKALKPFELPVRLWCHEETIINYYFYYNLKFIHRKYNYCFNRRYREPIPLDEVYLLHFPGEEKRYMAEIYQNKIVSCPIL